MLTLLGVTAALLLYTVLDCTGKKKPTAVTLEYIIQRIIIEDYNYYYEIKHFEYVKRVRV